MKMKKSIYFFVTNDIRYDQRMQRICAALHVAGFNVSLIGRKHQNSLPLDDLQFETRRFSCFFNAGPLFYLEINFRIFYYIIFHHPNAVCAIDLDTLWGVSCAKIFRSFKLIFDAHEYFTEVPEINNRKIVKSIWLSIANFGIPKSDLRYTVNQSLADLFNKQYGLGFGVVRNVPVTTNEISIEKGQKKIILYQGALNVGRGLEVAIDAMDSLPEYELHLVGEGDLSQELRERAKGIKRSNAVVFRGFMTPAELRKLTSTAYIGLNLLESSSLNYYYSLANKFFDYMHAGVPSINMAFPEYESILRKSPCGVTISSCTVDKLIAAIHRIDECAETYLGFIQEALEAKKIYNWEMEQVGLVDAYVNLFDQQK